MARRPRWVAAFVFAIVIAGSFAALGQWQLARGVEGGEVTEAQTETLVPLTAIATPQQPMLDASIGQRVTVEATFTSDEYIVLSGRTNLAEPGYWVVGHAVTSTGASLAVAMGWAESAQHAREAIERLAAGAPSGTLIGRYLANESPELSDFEAGERSAIAVAELINVWSPNPEGVYSGYLVLAAAPTGLAAIDAPPPVAETSLNLLNIFYAVEWVIFAGFAAFLWYRLVRDAVEGQQLDAAKAKRSGS